MKVLTYDQIQEIVKNNMTSYCDYNPMIDKQLVSNYKTDISICISGFNKNTLSFISPILCYIQLDTKGFITDIYYLKKDYFTDNLNKELINNQIDVSTFSKFVTDNPSISGESHLKYFYNSEIKEYVKVTKELLSEIPNWMRPTNEYLEFYNNFHKWINKEVKYVKTDYNGGAKYTKVMDECSIQLWYFFKTHINVEYLSKFGYITLNSDITSLDKIKEYCLGNNNEELFIVSCIAPDGHRKHTIKKENNLYYVTVTGNSYWHKKDPSSTYSFTFDFHNKEVKCENFKRSRKTVQNWEKRWDDKIKRFEG